MTALTPLLDQAEAHIQQAADALLASDTAQLEHSSSLLREAAALLSRALSGPAARAYRLSHAAADIQVQCPAR